MSTAPITGGGIDLETFTRQSELRTQKTMAMQESLASQSEDKATFDALLKQRLDNTKAISNMAEAASAIGKDASDKFNR